MKKGNVMRLVAALLSMMLIAGCGSMPPPPQPGTPPAISESAASAESSAPAEDSSSEASSEQAAALLGTFTAEDLEGNPVDESLLEGHKLTVLSIWATTCGYCLEEMPVMAALADEYADRGVQVVGIAADVTDFQGGYPDDLLADAKEMVEVTGADYQHLLPSTDLIERMLAYISGFPAAIFLDESGAMVGGVVYGRRSETEWRSMLDGMLADL